MLDLPQIVREHRKLSGLSQLGLAQIAGVGKTVIWDIEHGKRSVRFDTLEKVLAALNVHIEYTSPAMPELESNAMDEGD